MYPGAGAEVDDAGYTTYQVHSSSTPALGYKRKRNAPAPQLAGPVASPVRILPQFESFYTNPRKKGDFQCTHYVCGNFVKYFKSKLQIEI